MKNIFRVVWDGGRSAGGDAEADKGLNEFIAHSNSRRMLLNTCYDELVQRKKLRHAERSSHVQNDAHGPHVQGRCRQKVSPAFPHRCLLANAIATGRSSSPNHACAVLAYYFDAASAAVGELLGRRWSPQSLGRQVARCAHWSFREVHGGTCPHGGAEVHHLHIETCTCGKEPAWREGGSQRTTIQAAVRAVVQVRDTRLRCTCRCYDSTTLHMKCWHSKNEQYEQRFVENAS